MTRAPFDSARIDAIAFDLLTALIDSWSLWIEVAGEAALGRDAGPPSVAVYHGRWGSLQAGLRPRRQGLA